MNNGYNDYWHYEYAFEYPRKDISHFIVEVSPGSTANDFFNLVGVEDDAPAMHNPTDGKPNPGMPASIFGLKMEEGTNFYSFDSYKAPVWGDFYAVDGVIEGTSDGYVYAYNTDFLMADPTAPAKDGLLMDVTGAPIYKILRPDTVSTIPEPSTMILMGTILLGGGLVRRFRRK